MEDWEYDQQVEQLVEAFMPRVPDHLVKGFNSMMIGGEYTMAVDDLMVTLVKRQTPVTAAEREALQKLLRHKNKPTDDLDRLNVEPDTT